MSVISVFTGERSDSKIAAIFADEASARAVALRSQQALALSPSQVLVLTPDDRHPGRKLEPEGRGIFRTLLIAHFRLGLLGLLAGAVVFALMYAAGVDLIRAEPVWAGVLITTFGGGAGLLAGGLVTLRPDHTPLLAKVNEALEQGHCAVVVHPFDAGQRDRAERFLSQLSSDTIRTL
ncbi:MAG: hypothetical protein M0Q42_01935 [Xanthomonadales bacterium]|nr:hypothetical protein [Xanthomonadales bacterium]